ncbi:NINE protein [Roseofilum sp. BLCC_M154]|uniref:NINE protein n=1 Tax=Roseofilum acuticapitatum BLCC-M154 TaxID=3022444 RepID=A0ABT7ATL5_9CYAN|nr:NINE protein [Roseofilum acuticapitatum BLCC-M154]
MVNKEKSRKVGMILAFSGVLIPIAGLHKFYLGQPLWGVVYLLLSWTPIPHVASVIEAVWYLVQDDEEFNENYPGPVPVISGLKIPEVDWSRFWPKGGCKETGPIGDRVESVADALRQLESLRQEGLITEYEFEQKRRQLLDKIA